MDGKERRDEQERTRNFMNARRAGQAGKIIAEFSAGLQTIRERRDVSKGNGKVRREMEIAMWNQASNRLHGTRKIKVHLF